MLKRITLFITIALCALILGFFLPKQWLRPLFHHTGYYFMLAAFTVWGALVLECLHKNFLSNLKQHALALLASVILMALIFNISPPKYKVLADEINLSSVSMAMYKNKTASMPLQGFGVEYMPYDFEEKIDKRPLLYPFAISVVHAVAGYSPYNGMVVNFIFGSGILFLTYLLISRIFSRFFGFIGMIITASFPIFIFWSTSFGFEITTLFFIMFVLYGLYLFLNNGEVKFAELMLLSLTMLANCRYETAIFFIGLIVLLPRLFSREIISKYRISAYLFPLLLLPLAWQRQIVFVSPLVRVGREIQTADTPFGWNIFINNFSKNIYVITGLDPDYGFMLLVFIAAVAGIYLAARRLLLAFHAIPVQNRMFGAYAALTGSLLFLTYTSYFWGQFMADMSNRFAIAILPFLVLPAVYCLRKLFFLKYHAPGTFFSFFLVVHLLFYWPVGAQQKILKLLENNSLSYVYERVSHYLLTSYDLEHEKILLISDRPNLYLIHGVGSISFEFAVRHRNEFHFLENIYYDEILVVQKCNPINDEIKEKNQSGKNFRLTKIARINVNEEYYLKISKVQYVKKL